MKTLLNFCRLLYLSLLLIYVVFAFNFLSKEYNHLLIRHFICINHKIDSDL